jgi:L-fuconolactonase
VRGGVLVQAAPTEAETQFLPGVADAEAGVLGIVGWADMMAPDACRRIVDLALHPKLKALRPMLQDFADLDWILRLALSPALRAMVEHDLAFDVRSSRGAPCDPNHRQL